MRRIQLFLTALILVVIHFSASTFVVFYLGYSGVISLTLIAMYAIANRGYSYLMGSFKHRKGLHSAIIYGIYPIAELNVLLALWAVFDMGTVVDIDDRTVILLITFFSLISILDAYRRTKDALSTNAV